MADFARARFPRDQNFPVQAPHGRAHDEQHRLRRAQPELRRPRRRRRYREQREEPRHLDERRNELDGRPTKQPTGLTGGGSVAVAATGGGKIVWSPAGIGVHSTTNGGKAWTVSSGIPAGARVASDRVNASKFYGFSNGTFYVSTNGGVAFASTPATGLPLAAKFRAVPGREGVSWIRINDTEHQYAFTGACISGDPRVVGRVYVCTNGRGIIYGDPLP